MLNKFTFRQVLSNAPDDVSEDVKITIKMNPVNVFEFLDLIKRVSLAFGFQPDSIDRLTNLENARLDKAQR
jgi:hypothetical protein